MIRLIGPSVSTEAAGKLANTLIFSKTKKRAYVKSHASPANPRTGAQISVRAMMKWLSQEWKNLTTAEQATWINLAKITEITPYHAYVAANQLRWFHYATPSKRYPATEVKPPPGGVNATAVGGVGMVTYTVPFLASAGDWGILLLRKRGSYPTLTRQYAVALFPRQPAGNSVYVDTPLEPGTYYYFNIGFHGDGKKGSARGAGPVIVT